MLDDPIGFEVKEILAQDKYFGRIVNLLGQESLTHKEKSIVSHYTLDQGILYYKLCLRIPNNSEIKTKILWEVHNLPIVSHCGYVKTLNTVQKNYFCLGLKWYVL